MNEMDNKSMTKDEMFAIFYKAEEDTKKYASSSPNEEVLFQAQNWYEELVSLLQKSNYDNLEKVANLSGRIVGVAKYLNIKDKKFYCYINFIHFCRKSFFVKNNSKDIKFYFEELEKVAVSAENEFYKSKSNKIIAQVAAIEFNEAAIVILEKSDIGYELLDQACENLNKAEKMRKCSGDDFGAAFDFVSRSLYYRQLFIIRKDEFALKYSWECVVKALKILENKNISRQSHEFTFALIDACVKILRLGECHYGNKIKKNLFKKIDSRDKSRIDWYLIKDAGLENLWDAVRSNYLVFGYDDIPEWATEESYRKELDNYIPDSKSVKDALVKIRKISLNIGMSKTDVELKIINEFSKLGNSTASWYGIDNTIEVVINKMNSYEDCSGLLEILDYAIEEYYSERWSDSDRFSEFIRAFCGLISYANNKLGSVKIVSIFKKKFDEIGVNNDLTARNMAIDFLSIGEEAIAVWVFRSLFNMGLCSTPPILDEIKESGYEVYSLVLFHGFRGSGVVLLTGEGLNFYINHYLDGRRLTAYNYSLTNDKTYAFVTAMQTVKDRKIWMSIIDKISLNLRDVGSWIVNKIPPADNRILLVAGLGYYSFFPTSLISVDGDKRLVDYYTVINRSRLLCSNSKRDYSQWQWDSINVACCPELPSYFNLPDLPGAKKECESIKTLPWSTSSEKYYCSESDVIAFLQKSAIFHFSGHGKAPRLDSPPGLVTNSGPVGPEEMEESQYFDAPMATLSCCYASSNFSTLDIFGLDEYLIEKGIGVCISARWSVLDKNTASFMVEFYKGYLDRIFHERAGIVAVIESYREVQLRAKRKESLINNINTGLEWSSFIVTV